MAEMKPCFLCSRYAYTERHHIFGGANRKHSEEDGLVVDLCHSCHNAPPNGVHFNKANMTMLRVMGQQRYEMARMEEGMTAEEAHEAFMKRYGRNYL